MSTSRSTLPRTVLAAIAALIAAAALSAPDAIAKPTCKDRPYSNDAQASGPDGEPNAAGVRFKDHKYICVTLVTEKGPNSPIVRYTTRPRP